MQQRTKRPFNASHFSVHSIVWFSLFCFLIIVLNCFFIFTVCEAKENEKQPLEKIRLQLKWRHQFQFAGYYAAIEQGYFRNEGLEVELIEGGTDISPINELLTGKANFAIDSPVALINWQEGNPIVAVAAIFQHSPAVILTLADRHLRTPKSLKGKKIMIRPETDIESLSMLIAEGVQLKDITVLPLSESFEDLISHKVDAQTGYLTNEYYLLNKSGMATTSIKPIDYGIDFYSDCIFTTENEVRSHFNRIESFKRAVQHGWQYAISHQLELAEHIQAKYSQEKEIDQLLFEAKIIKKLVQPDYIEIGHMNPARWEHIAKVFKNLGLISSDHSFDGFLYKDLHKQVISEKQFAMRVVLVVVSIAGLLSLLSWFTMVLFNRKLTRQVKKRTASLAASEQNFRAFFEMASVGVAQVDIRTGKYKKINEKYCNILGFSVEELQNLTADTITHPDDLAMQHHHVELLLKGDISEFTIEKRYISKNGAIVWTYLTVSPLWKDGHDPDYIIVVIRDITIRKQAEKRLVFAQKVFDNSIEGIVVTDADGIIMQVNAAFSTITGYGAAEVIGHNPRLLKSDKHISSFYEEMWRKITTEGHWAGETWNRRKNGEAYPEWLTISAVKNNKGEVTNFVSIFHDISQHVQQQEVIKYQAQHDALTELPNRVLINDRLVDALDKSQRSGLQIALLYLDIDNFKYINDAFGHTVGDDILIELSQRFSSLMRNGDTVARLGGDDFLVLLTDLDDLDVVSNIAMQLLGALEKSFQQGDVDFFVTASVGVTISPDDGIDPVTIVKNSEVAMYRAKNLGKNNYQYFAPELDVQVHRRIALEMKLRKGIKLEEFELYYQPLVHSISGKIVGAEALIRWKSDGEIISPGEFIPLAEDSGLILPIGEWVLKSAARQAKIWQDAGYALTVSVNISSKQFAGQDLFTLLENVLCDTGLDPSLLYLEVTESVVMTDLVNAERIMGSLRGLGIKFYLDDFGTGYSSLAYLKRLPIDGLKIDRSFVKDIVEEPDSEAIAAVITSLANTLNLQIVAEGVETIEQWKMLHGMSEMLIQGYLVSKPVPASKFELLLLKGDVVWQECC
ncbi:MAG: EAL domain-containing protein [Desulfotalea sp.]